MGTRTKPLHTRKISAKVRKAHQAAVQAAEGGERWHIVTLVAPGDITPEDAALVAQENANFYGPLDLVWRGPVHVQVSDCDIDGRDDDGSGRYLELDDDYLVVHVAEEVVRGEPWDYTTQAAQDENFDSMRIPLWMIKSITKAEQPAPPPSLELTNGRALTITGAVVRVDEAGMITTDQAAQIVRWAWPLVVGGVTTGPVCRAPTVWGSRVTFRVDDSDTGRHFGLAVGCQGFYGPDAVAVCQWLDEQLGLGLAKAQTDTRVVRRVRR